jgi:hypothetical protein
MDISEVLINCWRNCFRKATEVGKSKEEYNTLEIVKVKILPQKKS